MNWKHKQSLTTVPYLNSYRIKHIFTIFYKLHFSFFFSKFSITIMLCKHSIASLNSQLPFNIIRFKTLSNLAVVGTSPFKLFFISLMFLITDKSIQLIFLNVSNYRSFQIITDTTFICITWDDFHLFAILFCTFVHNCFITFSSITSLMLFILYIYPSINPFIQ